MADDAPFIPPLGDFEPPTIHMNADAIAGDVVRVLDVGEEDLPPVEVEAAVGRREGAPWFAMVWAEASGRRWIMTPAVAREIGDRLARLSPRFPQLFTAAADQAEGLAEQHNRGGTRLV